MSFSIQTNVNSLVAQENMRVNGDFQSRTIQRLTSGYRINQSGDDAAGLAVANKFRSDVAELTQGVRNANDGVSTLQIIDGGLNNIGKMLDRMKTLATQAASNTFTGDRGTLNTEYSTLKGEITRQAANIGLAAGGANLKDMAVWVGGGSSQGNSQVQFSLTGAQVDAAGFLLNTTSITGSDNTMALAASADLTGSAVFLKGHSQTFSFSNIGGAGVASVSAQISGGTNGITGSQVLQSLNAQLAAYGISAGTDSSGKLTFSSSKSFDLGAVATGTGSDDIVVTAATTNSVVSTATTTDNAKTALTSLNAAVKSLGTIQGIVGIAQNQLGYAIQLAQSQISNFSAAESRIRDADVAAEAANLTKAQVLQQASIAAMAQANSAPQAVLSLLRG